MQWLAKLSVKRGVFATVLILVVLVLGVSSYKSLGLDMFPNVDLPVAVVTTLEPGAAAEEIESDITDKIEGAVNTISGIDSLTSSSSEGVSIVTIQFTLEKPGDVAVQEVRDKVSGIMADLPKGIDAPVISKIDPGASPVLYLALRSQQSVVKTSEIADKIVRRQIETLDGVGEVTLVGGRKRQINVVLDPVRLRAQNITALEIQRALATQNLNVPGGTVESGPANSTLRVAGRVTSLEAIGALVLRQQEGHPIRISDVATVEDGQEREESYAQFDDDRAVVLSVKKQSGKNTVAVVDTVLARLDEVRHRLPAGVSLDVVYDNSSSIRTSTDAVIEHLILGAMFAVVIVLVFLASGRSTIIAALAIPISIIGTFAVMYALGFTLNFLTLLALALAVGLVIDDAIVVIENIIRHIEEKGMKPFPAAIAATKDIGTAVLATTLALMAVFIPVSFMSGIIGRFLRSFGLTMASAIGVSLFVSFTLTPMLGARWLRRKDPNAPPDRLTRTVNALYGPIERAYGSILRFALGHRWVVVLGIVATILGTIPVAKHLTGGFLPSNDKGQFQITLRAPEGTSVAETRLIAERLSNEVRTMPGVIHALVTVGDDAEKTANLAGIRVILSDPKARDITQDQLMDRVRKQLVSKLPKSLRVSVADVPDIGNNVMSDVTVAITGPDPETLDRVSAEVLERLRKVPGAVDVDSSLILGKPETKVSIDRDRAADLGVQTSDIAGTLQLFVGGLKASAYPEGGEQYDIRVRGEERFRADSAALNILTVPSTKLGAVPLDSVVSLVETTGPSTIKRFARARQITISANAAPGVGSTFVTQKLEEIGREVLPPGYSMAAQGMSKESAKLVPQFAAAILLSVLFIYLVLAAQFESWLDPLCVMLILPLTIPFAFLSLVVLKQSINLFSLLGLLVLIGVVQKNAVLQVDHTKQLRAKGLPRLQAILEANKDRLRPILMTTLAFVAGMLPLVYSKGIGAGYNRAMSGLVVGGQTLSLLVTLLASPVIYSLLDDLALFLRRKLPRKQTAEETGAAELEVSP